MTASPNGPVVVTRVEGVLVAGFVADGDFTAEEAPAVRVVLESHVREGEALVLDLGGVRFIDSSGIGTIIGVHRLLTGVRSELRLARPSREVSAAFELVRLHRLIEIHPTVEAAVAVSADLAP